MNYTLAILLSFSIFVPATIGVFRWASIDKTYRPLIIYVLVSSLYETLALILVFNYQSTLTIHHIYQLIESILLLLILKQWNAFDEQRLLIRLLLLWVVCWVAENILIPGGSNICFVTAYSFATVLMSINIINQLIVKVQTNVGANSVFLACLAFIFYFMFKILIELFTIYGLTVNIRFRIQMNSVLIYLSLVANLVYAVVILRAPKDHITALL